MPATSIFGYPKSCLNTNCKHPFTKRSHLGWLPKSYSEIVSVMRCNKCKSKFRICQYSSEAANYFDNLFDDSQERQAGPISFLEIDEVKQALSENNILESLNDGMIPGTSQSIKPDNKHPKQE
jgi:hypothetical protein